VAVEKRLEETDLFSLVKQSLRKHVAAFEERKPQRGKRITSTNRTLPAQEQMSTDSQQINVDKVSKKGFKDLEE